LVLLLQGPVAEGVDRFGLCLQALWLRRVFGEMRIHGLERFLVMKAFIVAGFSVN
jgi:hypothetical protein